MCIRHTFTEHLVSMGPSGGTEKRHWRFRNKRGSLVLKCVCVCVCACACVVHFQQTYLSGVALNVALRNAADGRHGNKEMGAFLLHTLSDSLEKTLMLGKIEGKRRQLQRMT